MDIAVNRASSRAALIAEFDRVRGYTERLCAPLATDDYQIQSIEQTSPPKWHIAHVSWFFEAFVLPHFLPGYERFDPGFDFLFNSYYYTHGRMHPRPKRGFVGGAEPVGGHRDAERRLGDAGVGRTSGRRPPDDGHSDADLPLHPPHRPQMHPFPLLLHHHHHHPQILLSYLSPLPCPHHQTPPPRPCCVQRFILPCLHLPRLLLRSRQQH